MEVRRQQHACSRLACPLWAIAVVDHASVGLGSGGNGGGGGACVCRVERHIARLHRCR
jgi:hypothetical protein